MIASSWESKAVLAAGVATAAAVCSLIANAFGWSVVEPGLLAVTAAAAAAALYALVRARIVLANIRETAKRVASGDFDARIVDFEAQGEMRDLVNAVNAVLDNADAFFREAMAMFRHAAEEKYYRKIILTGMPGVYRSGAQTLNEAVERIRGNVVGHLQQAADRLEASVKHMSEQLGQTAMTLSSTSDMLTSLAEGNSHQVKALNTSSDEAAKSVSAVAASAEQMSASVTQIMDQVNRASDAAQTAAVQNQDAEKTLSALADRATQIGAIGGIIEDIAAKINLLALNATIEASHAGEAGKGFAVVANEVKELARQTAQAIADITQQVTATQTEIANTVQAVGAISTTIAEIKSISTAVATAAEQQTTATAEIARSAQHAAGNTATVTGAATEVSKASAETEQASSMVKMAVGELTERASQLDAAITAFIGDIKKIAA